MFSLLSVFGKHIWGKESQIAVRVDSIVLVGPVFDDNTGFCQRKEPLLIETLITQTIMETFHIGILPRTSRFDVERFDSIPTEILSSNPDDKLRPLSERMCPGIPRSAIARLRAANTSLAFRLRATVRLMHSRVNSSINERMRRGAPSSVLSATKSQLHTWLG